MPNHSSKSQKNHHQHNCSDDCQENHAHDDLPDLPRQSKHIYIYSPSGAVRDKAAFKRGVARLTALGHEVEIDSAALSSHLRFAGNDEERLASISRAAASKADVALISRGGYGLGRLLPKLPFSAIEKAIDNGTKFMGLSDFTTFQCAVWNQTKSITWSGSTLNADFGCEGEPDEIMLACFDDCLTGFGEGSGWQLPRKQKTFEQALSPDSFETQGTLWGSNLATLASLIGTSFMPKIENGILFLEDIGEHPYKIERLLMQLLYAGILEKQRAILMGQFTEFQLTTHDKGYKLDSVFQWLRAQLPESIPILKGLPFGHVATKILLPFGADVLLTVNEREAILYWGH